MSVNQEKIVLNASRFSDLHTEYHDRLLNSMTSVIRNRDAAQEITSRAFAKAFEKRDTFRGESKPESWLYQIAFNEARRQPQNRPVSLDGLESLPPSLVAHDRLDEASERSERVRRLKKALTTLPAIYRAALVDHFVHGYSVKEIARRVRIPVGTVLSRLFKAKRLLRAAWYRTDQKAGR